MTSPAKPLSIPLRPLRLAAEKAVEASRKRDEMIREYAARGVTMRSIATVVGLSAARVHQIIHGR